MAEEPVAAGPPPLTARSRQDSLAPPDPPPDMPLPSLPVDGEPPVSHRLAALYSARTGARIDTFTHHLATSTPLLDQSLPKASPTLSFEEPERRPSRRPSLGLTGPVQPTAQPRGGKKEAMRRAKSFTFEKPLNEWGPVLASKSSDQISRPADPPAQRPAPRSRRGSLFGRSAGEGDDREVPPPLPPLRRKSTFSLFRRSDSKTASPSPTPSLFASQLSSVPSTPALSGDEHVPRLPQVDTGSSLLVAFDPSTYGDSGASSTSLAPVVERTHSASTAKRSERTHVTRPRSSTASSPTTSVRGLRARLRRANSVSTTATVLSETPPPVPEKTPPLFTSSQPVSPASLSPAPSRRPSASTSVLTGLLRMGRRRSSMASPIPWLSQSNGSNIFGFTTEPAEHEEVIGHEADASTSKLTLPVLPADSRRPSSSSMSSAQSGLDQSATTNATSQQSFAMRKAGFGQTQSSINLSTAAKSVASPSMLTFHRNQDESPSHYLERLRETCSPSEIARVLASSSDPANIAALQAYVSSFDFEKLPIDVALRKLLMDLYLPRETQQIDRVMEAFAKRYHQQNPHLFISSDQPYLLAFAMIMLHTDAFNAANKNKMTKPAFVKNTTSDGVSSLLLEYIYDNICFSPFVFVDEVDVNGQRSLASDSSPLLSTGFGGGKAKVDVYHLITNNLTSRLRAEVDLFIPTKNPYSFTGTVPFFNSTSLHKAFADAPPLRVILPPRPPPSLPGQIQPEVLIPRGEEDEPSSPSSETISTFRISRVGLLFLKGASTATENGKKSAARKWREWSVILTGSQLLFFRDPIWGLDLSNQLLRAGETGISQLKAPRDILFRPDSVISLQDAVAVFDWTFTERANCFTLLLPGGRHHYLQAPDAAEMNDWIALINYAASFKTAGVRMRGSSSGHLLSRSLGMIHAATASIVGMTPSSTGVTLADSVKSAPDSDQVNGLADSALGIETLSPESLVEWDDDYVFEQFSSSDLRYRTDGASKNVLVTRSDIIRNKLVALEASIAVDKASLQADLRQAHSLSVLTPFSPSTRQRIQSAVAPLARRVRATRLALCKGILVREVLARDLLADERETQRARYSPRHASHIALPPVSATDNVTGPSRRTSVRSHRFVSDTDAPSAPPGTVSTVDPTPGIGNVVQTLMPTPNVDNLVADSLTPMSLAEASVPLPPSSRVSIDEPMLQTDSMMGETRGTSPVEVEGQTAGTEEAAAQTDHPQAPGQANDV